MGFLDRLLKGTKVEANLEETQLNDVVILRENIVYSDKFKQDHKLWSVNGAKEELLRYLRDNYKEKQQNRGSEVNLFLHESTRSNGFYFRREFPWETNDFNHLIYLFCSKLQDQQYVRSQAIREVKEEKGVLKGQEMYYLKPSLRFRRELPYRQLFGNIEIEHRLQDGESELLKVVATTYSDHNYERPYDFEDLMHEFLVL